MAYPDSFQNGFPALPDELLPDLTSTISSWRAFNGPAPGPETERRMIRYWRKVLRSLSR